MKRRDLFRMGALVGVSLSDVGASTAGVWREPARDTPVAESADVIVCGAGPAGVSAALSAARTGARTRLIEVHGCLGGVWTAGLLSNIIDSGGKTGLMPEILSRLRETGTQIDAFRYDAECMKRLLETMCTEAGVKVLLHTRVVAAYKDSSNKLTTVVTENKSGRQAWHGKAFVDTTGDGDLAALAGCRFDLGHPVTGKMQPMTLMALLMGVDYAALHERRLMRGDGITSAAPPPKGISPEESKRNFVVELRRAGIEPSYLGPTLFPVRNNLIAIMVNHEYGYSAISAQQVTDATFHARQEVNRVVDALRELGGVWKDVRLVVTGEQIGTREGRRVRGRYVVTKDDLIRGTRFADAVCRVTSGVDIHSLDAMANKKTTSEGIHTKPYHIPLRSLIAADVDGLLMAGRCISGDFFAHASYRMTGNAVPMGEAAGKVAASAAAKGCLPQQVDWHG